MMAQVLLAIAVLTLAVTTDTLVLELTNIRLRQLLKDLDPDQ